MKRTGAPLEDSTKNKKQKVTEDYAPFLQELSSQNLDGFKKMNSTLQEEKKVKTNELANLTNSFQKVENSRIQLVGNFEKLGGSLLSLFFSLQMYYYQLPCTGDSECQADIEEIVKKISEFPITDNRFCFQVFDENITTSLFENILNLFQRSNELFQKEKVEWENAQKTNSSSKEWNEFIEKDNTMIQELKGKLQRSKDKNLSELKKSLIDKKEKEEKKLKEYKKKGKKNMNEDLFHLKEGLDRLERQTHRLQLAKKQQELNEAQMEIDLNNNNDNNILKIENYTSPLNSPMKKKKNNNNNNNNKHLILENNNHMDAQVNIEEQGQITLEDELKQLISQVEIKQEEIDKLREHLINTMKQIRESKMTDSIGAVESAAVTTNLYSSFYKKMTDSQNRFTAFFGEWQKQASNLLEYREKRYAEKESNRKRLKAKKSEHEAVIMQSEVKLKQVQAEKEKISYETEFLKSKIPRAQVVDLLTSQISLLTNMWEKQYENIKFLEMEIDETNHLIEEKKKSIDPTSLEKMSKEKMKIVKEAQIEFEKLMDELQIAREKEYELRDLELKNISKFLKSENAMETEIFNERSTTSLTESERELNNDKLQSQIYELRNKIKNAYEPSILLKDYQNEFPQERDTKESDTSLLEEINWHIQQIKYYERRLKSAKEEGERKTEEMNILSKNFISIQSENESILKQMQLCEDKSMSLASDTLTLDQTVTATQKKIDVAQEKIRKMELKNDELDNQLHQSRGVVNHLEERVERYDADIKTQQLKFAKCYIPIKDFYLSCSDFIQKIKKHQEELEKLRKLKSPENDRQLKEEKTTTSSLNSECNILKKKLEGYSKNLLRTSSGINEGGNKQEELEKYKSMVRCSVCTDRQKDTVLTTCFHVFCKSCLESNLASRHRKCPGCNIPFDRPNMRSISL